MNVDELEKYALARGLNLGQAEKDYYQNLALFVLYNKSAKELVFKGGTALSKCYGLNRFSEDLDFTVGGGERFIQIVEEGFESFGVRCRIRELPRADLAKKYRIKLEGPLYKGTERSLCSVTLDFSMRERVLLEPSIVTVGYHMDIIPAFEVYVMKEEEIFAEKIRALMSRKSARDLYDAVFLLRKGVEAPMGIVEKKLEFYKLEYDAKELRSRCESIRGIWNNELKSLVRNVPGFDDYAKEIGEWAKGT